MTGKRLYINSKLQEDSFLVRKDLVVASRFNDLIVNGSKLVLLPLPKKDAELTFLVFFYSYPAAWPPQYVEIPYLLMPSLRLLTSILSASPS